jgi:hypothetical protein
MSEEIKDMKKDMKKDTMSITLGDYINKIMNGTIVIKYSLNS